MCESNVRKDDPVTEQSGESDLRGTALNGSEQKSAADHEEYLKKRNPDTVLHLAGEDDSLYNDGLEVGDDSGTPFGTPGNK